MNDCERTSNLFNKTLLVEYPMHILGLIAGSVLVFIAIAISWTLFIEYPDDFQAGMSEAEQQAQYRFYLTAWSIAAAIGAYGIIIIVYFARKSPSLYQPHRNNPE
jgi:hypothetical protein